MSPGGPSLRPAPSPPSPAPPHAVIGGHTLAARPAAHPLPQWPQTLAWRGSHCGSHNVATQTHVSLNTRAHPGPDIPWCARSPPPPQPDQENPGNPPNPQGRGVSGPSSARPANLTQAQSRGHAAPTLVPVTPRLAPRLRLQVGPHTHPTPPISPGGPGSPQKWGVWTPPGWQLDLLLTSFLSRSFHV